MKHCIALTKLRVSSHCLAIETGRYHKPTSLPVDQRLCAECGVLEDEVHFLCDCVRYSFLREDLFSVAIPYFPEFSMLSSREKFLFLLQTEYTCSLAHQGSGCLKADSTKTMVRMSNGSCYDAMPSKPILGRGLADGQQPVSTVTKCGSKRCLTCKHISEGSSFTSNITKKKYKIDSPNSGMDCSSRNVIYLTS